MRYLKNGETAKKKSTAGRQAGFGVLVTTFAVFAVVGVGLTLAQLSGIKSAIASTNTGQIQNTAATQGANAAIQQAVSYVNNLSSSGTCAASTNCGTGIYGVGVLSGGARNKDSSWWTTAANVHSYTYPGLTTAVAYVIEETSCNSTSGLTNYNITARAVGNSSTSTLQGKNVVLAYGTATHTWAPTTTTVALYDYSCDANTLTYITNAASFTVGAAGNLSSYNINQPYSAFSSSIAGGTGLITQIEAGIGTLNTSTSLQITVTVAGSQIYTGTLSSGPMSDRPYSACSSGNNMSVFLLPTPISVSMNQVVGISFGTCSSGGTCSMHYNTVGRSPGNNSATQLRYRIIGTQSTNNCPVAS